MKDRRISERVKKRAVSIFLCFSWFAILWYATPAQSIRTVCPDKSSADYYFPKNTIFPKEEFYDRSAQWFYSFFLRDMGEPSLTCGNPQRTFRFLWHRSFHSSFAVRVEISDDQARLYAVELEIVTKDGSDPIGRRLEKALDPEDLRELEDAFARTKFWSIKTTPREANMDGSGHDGSQWLIEGVENSRHHSAARWSPKEGPIRELGLLFLKFTGWKFEENEIY